MDWLKTLKSYAPDIAAAIVTGGTSLPALAVKAVSDVLGKEVTDTTSLAESVLAASPEDLVKLKQANNEFILKKLQLEFEDVRSEHKTTQETIRNGDNATDREVRLTRPTMAKQSWTATIWYCVGCFGVHAISGDDLFNTSIAMILSSPAWAYLGLRTGDKFSEALKHWGKK